MEGGGLGGGLLDISELLLMMGPPIDEDDELIGRGGGDERMGEGAEGGGAWAFKLRPNIVPSSSGSANFNGENSMVVSPLEGTSNSLIRSARRRRFSV